MPRIDGITARLLADAIKLVVISIIPELRRVEDLFTSLISGREYERFHFGEQAAF